MGIFDLFRKKKIEDISSVDIDNNLNMGPEHPDFSDIASPSQQQFGQGFDMGQSAVNLSTMSTPMQAQPFSQPSGGLDKDIQIISLKLDAIKSEIDSMNQRIKNIEMIAEKEQQSVPQKRWY